MVCGFLLYLPKYLLILSASDECSQHWRKFLEVSKLQLRKDVGWRESYAAVVDGGMVKADERSVEEIMDSINVNTYSDPNLRINRV